MQNIATTVANSAVVVAAGAWYMFAQKGSPSALFESTEYLKNHVALCRVVLSMQDLSSQHMPDFIASIEEFLRLANSGDRCLHMHAGRQRFNVLNLASQMLADAKRSRVERIIDAAIFIEKDDLPVLHTLCDEIEHDMIMAR